MLYIILGIVMVLYSWLMAAHGKMQKHKKDARAQWVRVDALLQTRAQYILRLLELADENEIEASELLASIYEMGGGYCKDDDREVVSACAEKVTPLLDRLIELTDSNQKLSASEEYRELRENLADMEEEIEIQSERYNHTIDLYNEHRAKPSLRIQIAILGAPVLKGIHIKSQKLSLERE